MNIIRLSLAVIAVCSVLSASAQSKKDVIALAAAPKNLQHFPTTYGIALPAPTMEDWDRDYNTYRKYLTPIIMKRQCGLSFEYEGVTTFMCTSSAMPHAQMDTATIIRNEAQLQGTWRAVSHRMLRFVDSVSFLTKQIYRSDTVLNDLTNEDAFAFFSDGQFKLFAQKSGKQTFKQIVSAKYQLESGRYLILSKYLNMASGLSQIGIDGDGRLLSHYASVIERRVNGRYIVYTGVVEQIVMEKLL